MMRKSGALALLAMMLVSPVGLAADATGVWRGEVKLPTGQTLPFVVRLAQDGATVSGRMDGINGAPDVVITDGKVVGDTLTFSGVRQINDAPVKFNYIAKFLDDDTLDFQILREDGSPPLASVTKRSAE